MLHAVFILVAIAGAWVLLRGVRRQYSATGPCCARCRYDLRGTPRPLGTCAECGSNLTAPEAVATTRPRLGCRRLVAAGLLLTVGLGGFGVVQSGVLQRINWLRFAPGGWLVERVDAHVRLAPRPGGGGTIFPASRSEQELLRRITAGRIAEATVARILEHALPAKPAAAPANASKWTDLMVALHADGHVLEGRLLEFLERGLAPPGVTASWENRTREELHPRRVGRPQRGRPGCPERAAAHARIGADAYGPGAAARVRVVPTPGPVR